MEVSSNHQWCSGPEWHLPQKGCTEEQHPPTKRSQKKQSFKTDPGLGMLLRVDLQLVYVRHSDPQHSKHHNFVTQHWGYLGVMRLMNRAKYEKAEYYQCSEVSHLKPCFKHGGMGLGTDTMLGIFNLLISDNFNDNPPGYPQRLKPVSLSAGRFFSFSYFLFIF